MDDKDNVAQRPKRYKSLIQIWGPDLVGVYILRKEFTSASEAQAYAGRVRARLEKIRDSLVKECDDVKGL